MAWKRCEPGKRTNLNDSSTLTRNVDFSKYADTLSSDTDRPPEVRLELCSCYFFRESFSLSFALIASIVDDNIKAAEAFDNCYKCGIDTCAGADVKVELEDFGPVW